MEESRFLGPDGKPRLIECAVLFFDLLGVSAMAQGAKAEKELLQFDQTIRNAVPYPIGAAAAEKEAGAYPTTVFSDSVVQAVPIPEGQATAETIFHVLLEVAQLQITLAKLNYFARGAITLDRFHSYDGLLFGPALVEAVGLEHDVAVDPRIVLSPAASTALLEAAAADPHDKAYYEEAPVLVDEDGVPFVDYLAGALQADPELDMPETLEVHRDVVTERLRQQRTNFHRWSKHRWVAEYHNATCFKFREALKKRGGFEAFLVDSIHTSREFMALAPAGQG